MYPPPVMKSQGGVVQALTTDALSTDSANAVTSAHSAPTAKRIRIVLSPSLAVSLLNLRRGRRDDHVDPSDGDVQRVDDVASRGRRLFIDYDPASRNRDRLIRDARNRDRDT